jgi:hypothetical protein
VVILKLTHDIVNVSKNESDALTPKGQSPFFGPFLKFGQAIIMDAIFVQKISIFWRTCGLVLASRCTNFY